MITVNGLSLQTLVWHTRTIGDRMAVAGRRGGNTATAVLDGALWTPDKPLDELSFDLEMWIIGSDPDGDMPDEPDMARRVLARIDQLLATMAQQHGLVELVDTVRGRRCWAEISGGFAPSTMAGGTRAEVTFPIVVPTGCWEDVALFDTGELPLSGTATLTGAGGGTVPLSAMTVRLTPPGRNIELTLPNGQWITFDGDLPAGNPTVIMLDPLNLDAKQDGSATSLIGRVRWNGMPPLRMYAASDPQVTIAAEAITAASRIRFTGRRRWLSV